MNSMLLNFIWDYTPNIFVIGITIVLIYTIIPENIHASDVLETQKEYINLLKKGNNIYMQLQNISEQMSAYVARFRSQNMSTMHMSLTPAFFGLCERRDILRTEFINVVLEFGLLLKKYPQEYQTLFNVNDNFFPVKFNELIDVFEKTVIHFKQNSNSLPFGIGEKHIDNASSVRWDKFEIYKPVFETTPQTMVYYKINHQYVFNIGNVDDELQSINDKIVVNSILIELVDQFIERNKNLRKEIVQANNNLQINSTQEIYSTKGVNQTIREFTAMKSRIIHKTVILCENAEELGKTKDAYLKNKK